ncbi:MAG: DUF503 domain-containing protein [Chloroflexi bacterium]|nr:DUF503 domain-containing protein [Chloroflexota bacterium]
MHVGVLKVTLRLPENQSLKGKRRTISSLSSRVRDRYNVAVAEVGDNDAWQIATLGIACVSNSARHADEVMARVVGYVEASREDVEVVDSAIETLSGF